MRQYKCENEKAEGWRCYPIRVVGAFRSKCHHAPTLLVESKPGGYVTTNCSVCNERDRSFDFQQFMSLDLWVSCPECGRRMEPGKVPPKDQNYGYTCQACQLYVWLSQLLPRYEGVRPT